MFEHDHQFFGNIEERGDGYSANKEIDDQCSLIEYANLLGLVPLPTDFIGQACIQTYDDEIAKGEGKHSGYSHAHQQNLMGFTPPQINQNYGIVQKLTDETWEDVRDDLIVLLLVFLLFIHL